VDVFPRDYSLAMNAGTLEAQASVDGRVEKQPAAFANYAI
jgi:hypothetical protein